MAITAFVRPGRSTLLYRCARPACIDAAFASAVLAVYCTASRVPAAQGVSDEDAARVRVTLENAALCDALARKGVLTAQVPLQSLRYGVHGTRPKRESLI